MESKHLVYSVFGEECIPGRMANQNCVFLHSKLYYHVEYLH